MGPLGTAMTEAARVRIQLVWKHISEGEERIPLRAIVKHAKAIVAAGWKRGVTTLLREFDDDGDAMLSLGNFETALAYCCRPSSFEPGGAFSVEDLGPRDADELLDLRAQMRQTFDAIDKDKNGVLSTSELHVNWSKLRALGLRTPSGDVSVAEIFIPFLKDAADQLSVPFATFERALAYYQDVGVYISIFHYTV